MCRPPTATSSRPTDGHGSDTLPGVSIRPVLPLLVGDVVRLRRRHPCGGDSWQVDRLGADIGVHCQGCGRALMIDRIVLEQRIVEHRSVAGSDVGSA